MTVELEGLPGKAVYYGDSSISTCCPGQRITDTVRLQSAARIRDDDVTAFTSKGVFLLAYGQGTAQIETGSAGSVRWCRSGWHGHERADCPAVHRRYRRICHRHLNRRQVCPVDPGCGGLSEAGLYHVLAVSGMHCGFLLV